jgi:hypothetical protein
MDPFEGFNDRAGGGEIECFLGNHSRTRKVVLRPLWE